MEIILLTILLITAAAIDIRSMYVPDHVHLCILALASLSLISGRPPSVSSRICGSILIGGIMLLVSILTKGGIGGGDIKLMAASGLLLGFSRNLLAFILAYLFAGLVYIIPMLTGRISKNTPIPMIPYFAASILISAAFGEPIIHWYMQFFIL